MNSLRKIRIVTAGAAAALAFISCSSTPSNVSSGTIHARTFSFLNRKSKSAPDYADKTETAHKMIQAAITKNLAARGVTRVAAGGDVLVPYLIITGNNVSTTAISDYFGYNDDLSGLHERAQDAYTSQRNPNHFDAGTLLIDIVDGKSFKLLKRGYTTRTLAGQPSAGQIQGAVDEILRDVQIGP
jgi:Domain of unknown function (DUF4136)